MIRPRTPRHASGKRVSPREAAARWQATGHPTTRSAPAAPPKAPQPEVGAELLVARCLERWACRVPGCYVLGQTNTANVQGTNLAAHMSVVHGVVSGTGVPR